MSRAVVLARYSTLEEALVVRGLLLARGIPASTSNRQHAGNDWGSIPAFGGVGILVPAEALEEAHAFVLESIRDAPEVLSATGASPEAAAGRLGQRIRAISMLVIYLGILNGLLWLILTLLVPATAVEPEGYIYAQSGYAVDQPLLELSSPGAILLLFVMAALTLFDAWKVNPETDHIPEGYDLPSFDL